MLGSTDYPALALMYILSFDHLQVLFQVIAAADKFSFLVEENTGHVMSQAMWDATIRWLDQHLKRR